jgi:hypothetical protein
MAEAAVEEAEMPLLAAHNRVLAGLVEHKLAALVLLVEFAFGLLRS